MIRLPIALLALALAAPVVARAQEKLIIHHSGRLLDQDDAPVSGARSLTVSIFERDQPPTTGVENAVWSKTYDVQVKNGVYSVILGNDDTLLASHFAGARYLELKVGEQRLQPRQPIGAMPYAASALVAKRAEEADKIGGKSLADLEAMFAPKTGGTYVSLQSGTATAQAGGIAIDGTMKAAAFDGSGASLTALDASKIVSGTLADGRLAATYAQQLALSNAQNAYAGTLTGNVTGDVTGNLTGNVTGNLTGSVTNGQLKGRTVIEPLNGAPSAGDCSSATLGGIALQKTGELWACTTLGWKPVGKRPGQLAWAENSVDFGTVTLFSSQKTITLRNVGDEAVTGLAVRVPEGFRIDTNGCGVALAAGGSCTVVTSFLPEGERGNRNALIFATAASGSSAALPAIGLFTPPGGSKETAALSCKAIKTAYADALDGVYWLNPNQGPAANAFQAFCEMSTDGGGWTFFAHLNNSTINSYNQAVFSGNIGTYRTDRADGALTYSRGAAILPYINHTELMIALDTAIPAAANLSNKLVTYKYAPGATSFNSGGGTCTGSSPFSFRLDLDGPYVSGAWSSCTSANWYPSVGGSSATYLSLMGAGSTQTGVYWGVGMSGNSSWGHDAYFYAR